MLITICYYGMPYTRRVIYYSPGQVLMWTPGDYQATDDEYDLQLALCLVASVVDEGCGGELALN